MELLVLPGLDSRKMKVQSMMTSRLEALPEIALSDERARTMGMQGRRWLERDFSPEAHYRSLERVYEEVRAK